MNALVMRREVQVKHEQRQFQELEVQYDVPESDFVIADKVLVHEDLISLLHQDVEELFVQGYRW